MKIIFFVTHNYSAPPLVTRLLKARSSTKKKFKIVCSIYLTTKDKMMSQIIFKI